MALIVETGAGLANADSYVSLSDASTIATSLGLSFAIAGADEALAEAALRRATVWMDAQFRNMLSGWRTKYRLQALEFPRTGMWDNGVIPQLIAADEVPTEWKRACVVAAVREKASPGSLSPDVTTGLVAKREKVEGAVEVEYFGAPDVDAQRPIITMIDDILAPLINTSRVAPIFGSVSR